LKTAKEGDEIHLSTNSTTGKILKRNDDGTFDVVLTVTKNQIYTKE
jgi:hypothetical protein